MTGPALNLVVLRSGQSERLVAFYEAVGVRFVRHRHGTGPEHWASESGPVVFEIYPASPTAGASSGVRLGFRVSSVESTLVTVTEAGAAVVTPPKPSPWGLRAVVADPDGNRVELTEERG